MGRRKTELQLLQDTHDRKQQELQAVLQDAETDIAARQRDIQVRMCVCVDLGLGFEVGFF